jgi:hypothetical protein
VTTRFGRSESVSFGQPSGPPASFRQIEELTALLLDAGHSDFRDARGPMGFTQRQSGGKFTRDEAAAYIERLHQEADGGSRRAADPAPGSRAVARTSVPGPPRRHEALQRMTSEQWAAELERRGWTVQPPKPS